MNEKDYTIYVDMNGYRYYKDNNTSKIYKSKEELNKAYHLDNDYMNEFFFGKDMDEKDKIKTSNANKKILSPEKKETAEELISALEALAEDEITLEILQKLKAVVL